MRDAVAEEVEAQMREAIAFHIKGLRKVGYPIPQPASRVNSIEVTA